MKLFLSFLSGILLFSITSSCQKSPINGDLDGQWEVVEVIPEPEVAPIIERIYYNFSLHVCMLSYNGGTVAYANMTYDGKTMLLDFAEITPEGNWDDLPQYGIFTNPITFNVKFSDSHHLTLSNNEVTVILIKH